MTDFDDKLANILTRVFRIERDEIKDDLKRKDFEPWDSMAHLMLVSEVENEFEIFFEDEEVVDIWTVADLKQILKKKVST